MYIYAALVAMTDNQSSHIFSLTTQPSPPPPSPAPPLLPPPPPLLPPPPLPPPPPLRPPLPLQISPRRQQTRPRSLSPQNEAPGVTEMKAKKRRIGVGPRDVVQVYLKQYSHNCGYS